MVDMKIQAGPDFRNYENDSAGHVTPVKDLNMTKYYGEALATATITEKDSLTFKYKYWQWLAGTGKVPYADGLPTELPPAGFAKARPRSRRQIHVLGFQ